MNIGNIIMIKFEGTLQYSTATSPQTICLLMTDRRGSNYSEHFKERLNVCQTTLHRLLLKHSTGLLKGKYRFLAPRN